MATEGTDAPKLVSGRFSRGTITKGNTVSFLVDGEATYISMLEAIRTSKYAVTLESYIFEADKTGRRFLDALCEARRRGLRVRVLIDAVGSSDTNIEFFRPLLDLGGELGIFNPPSLLRPLWSIKRDHRKILTVDDQVGFTGGLNISDDYAPVDWGGRGWHDMQARIEGPAARELTKLVNRAWRRTQHEDWSGPLLPAKEVGSTRVQVLGNSMRQRWVIHRSYVNAIRNARHRIRLWNAYFVPDRAIRHAIIDARRRGVRVELILAGETDVWAVKLASRALYSLLLDHDVQIYEWTDRVLHAKAAVIDGSWCSMGSFNLDAMSLRHNLEANIALVDATLGATLDAQFEHDRKRCELVDRTAFSSRPHLDRLLERAFFAVRHVL